MKKINLILILCMKIQKQKWGDSYEKFINNFNIFRSVFFIC